MLYSIELYDVILYCTVLYYSMFSRASPEDMPQQPAEDAEPPPPPFTAENPYGAGTAESIPCWFPGCSFKGSSFMSLRGHLQRKGSSGHNMPLSKFKGKRFHQQCCAQVNVQQNARSKAKKGPAAEGEAEPEEPQKRVKEKTAQTRNKGKSRPESIPI